MCVCVFLFELYVICTSLSMCIYVLIYIYPAYTKHIQAFLYELYAVCILLYICIYIPMHLAYIQTYIQDFSYELYAVYSRSLSVSVYLHTLHIYKTHMFMNK